MAAGRQRDAMRTHRIVLNRLLLFSILVALAVWTALQFLGAGARGNFELWGIGRVTGVIEGLVILFLLANRQQLRRASDTTRVVLAWIPWVLLSVSFSVRGDLTDWILGGPFPVLLWPLSYLFFFALVRSTGSTQMLERYFFWLSVGCVVAFFAVFETVNAGRSAGFQQLNAVYYPLLTLPWVATVRKPAWRAAGALLVVTAVSYSLKRTALVALGLGAIAYVVLEMRGRSTTSRLRLAVPLAALLALSAMAYFRVDEMLGDAFSERLLSSREDAGSNRLVIYREVITAVEGARVENLLFGHGHHATLDRFGITAHNDFLEVVYDYGAVGLILYCLLHLALLRTAFALIRERSEFASPFALAYVLFFSMSMTSHLLIYPTYFVFLVSFWGAIEGARRHRGQIERLHDVGVAAPRRAPSAIPMRRSAMPARDRRGGPLRPSPLRAHPRE